MKKLLVASALTLPMIFGFANAQTNTTNTTAAAAMTNAKMQSMNHAPSAIERQVLHAKKQECKGKIDQTKHGKARKALIKACMAA